MSAGLVVIHWVVAVASGVLAVLVDQPARPLRRRPGPPPPAGPRLARREWPGRQGGAVRAAGSITLAFAGDVNFADRTARLLADPATASGPIAAVLPVGLFGCGEPGDRHHRRRDAAAEDLPFPCSALAAFTALRAAGIDLVTMANNHVLVLRAGPAGGHAGSGQGHPVPVRGDRPEAAAAGAARAKTITRPEKAAWPGSRRWPSSPRPGWRRPAGRRTCEPRPLAQDGQIRPARRWVPGKPGPG